MNETLIATRPLNRSGVCIHALLAVVAGLAVGWLTFVGQRYLRGPLNPLVNSVSAWLVAPWLLGALMRSKLGGAVAGLALCSLEVIGYYAAAAHAGYSDGAMLAYWLKCAAVGGPLFGLAGHLWRSGPRSLRGLAGAALPGVFLSEGLYAYAYQLHDRAATVLWLGIAGGLMLVLGRRRPSDAGWLLATTVVGLVGQALLRMTY